MRCVFVINFLFRMCLKITTTTLFTKWIIFVTFFEFDTCSVVLFILIIVRFYVYSITNLKLLFYSFVLRFGKLTFYFQKYRYYLNCMFVFYHHKTSFLLFTVYKLYFISYRYNYKIIRSLESRKEKTIKKKTPNVYKFVVRANLSILFIDIIILKSIKTFIIIFIFLFNIRL